MDKEALKQLKADIKTKKGEIAAEEKGIVALHKTEAAALKRITKAQQQLAKLVAKLPE